MPMGNTSEIVGSTTGIMGRALPGQPLYSQPPGTGASLTRTALICLRSVQTHDTHDHIAQNVVFTVLVVFDPVQDRYDQKPSAMHRSLNALFPCCLLRLMTHETRLHAK